MNPRSRAVIALGANMGDPLAALRGAVEALQQHPEVDVVSTSSVYATAPVGGPEQDDYLNAVVLIDTDLTPRELLALAHRIENDWHRTREVRWGPRTLDIDLIAIHDRDGDVVMDDPDLTLPHPRAHERAFVCVPWAEVEHGVDLASLDTSGVQRTEWRLEAS